MSPSRRFAVPAVICLWLPASCGGCAFVAYVASVFFPPPLVPAKYEIPSGKAILVFVNDPIYTASGYSVRNDLTVALGAELIDHKIAGRLVPPKRLYELQAATGDSPDVTIQQIARRTGADLVLYVEVWEFSLGDEATDPMPRGWEIARLHGKLGVRVLVVDGEAGRLWPRRQLLGHTMELIEYQPAKTPGTQVTKDKVVAGLAATAARQIAKLFYDHRPKGIAQPRY